MTLFREFPKRKIDVAGYQVEVISFPNGAYMYPCFNGNAEFKVNHKGFRDLSHYLRNVRYYGKLMKEIWNNVEY